MNNSFLYLKIKSSEIILPSLNPKHKSNKYARKSPIDQQLTLQSSKELMEHPVYPKFELKIPTSLSQNPEYKEYLKMNLLQGSQNLTRVCLNCQVEFFFHLKEPNQKIQKCSKDGYQKANRLQKIFFLFVQLYTGYNAYVPNLAYYVSAKHINIFLTRFIPKQIQEDSDISSEFLFEIYNEFGNLIRFLHQNHHITSNEESEILTNLLPFEQIQQEFKLNRKLHNQSLNLLKDSITIWAQPAISIPYLEYEQRIQKELKLTNRSLTKFEWELAEAIRFYLGQNIQYNQRNIFYNTNRMLEICITFAIYTNDLIEILNQAKFPYTRLHEIWPYYFFIWGGPNFFIENSFQFFPYDTILTTWEIIEHFIFTECKKCKFVCLRHTVLAKSMYEQESNVLLKN